MECNELRKHLDSFSKRYKKNHLYQILAKNKCLYAAYKLGLIEINNNDIRNKLIVEEKKFFNTLKYLNKVFTNNKIKYILIKTKYPVPYIDNNIDVLIENQSDWLLLKEVLSKSGFVKQTISPIRYWHPYNEDYKEMWSKDGNDFVSIHLHYNIAWRGIIYLDKDAIFKFRKKIKLFGFSFFVPDPNSDFLIHSAHSFFENFNINFLDYLNFIFYQNKVNLDYCIRKAEKYGWEGVLDIICEAFKAVNIESHFPIHLSISNLSQIRFKKIIFDLLNLRMKMLFRDIIMYPIDFFAYSIYHRNFFKSFKNKINKIC